MLPANTGNSQGGSLTQAHLQNDSDADTSSWAVICKQIPVTWSEIGINCLGSILNLSSPEGGSGQGMFVPEESGKEKENPTNTQAPQGLVFHEVSLMMSYKK